MSLWIKDGRGWDFRTEVILVSTNSEWLASGMYATEKSFSSTKFAKHRVQCRKYSPVSPVSPISMYFYFC